MLDPQKFLTVIEATPLVSIDLLVRNASGQILLGKRLNRPAQGFWFVPGGRIRKNELVQNALQRISSVELGFPIQQADLVGVFDHIYDDNFANVSGINTHYVVLGFQITVADDAHFKGDAQHGELKWWSVADAAQNGEVHANTRRYLDFPLHH